MRFRATYLEGELYASDYRLRGVLELVERELFEWDLSLEITSVERTDAETLELYTDAGLPPPASSVHGTLPCRGADAVPWSPHAASEDWDAICEAAAKRVSGLAVYPRGFDSVVWHNVSGTHFHVQVPWDSMAFGPRG